MAKYLDISRSLFCNHFTLIGEPKIFLERRLNVPVLIRKITLYQHITRDSVIFGLFGENIKPACGHPLQDSFRLDLQGLVVECNQGRTPVDRRIPE